MTGPRSIASALLLFTGVAHVAEFALRSHAPPMLIAGIVYLALGLWLRRPGRIALWASLLLPAIGGLGGLQGLRATFDPILAVMVAIDAAVVVCCAAALWRK
jgi:hypothetical protein